MTRLALAVAYYSYCEQSGKVPGVAPRIYTWRIDSTVLDSNLGRELQPEAAKYTSITAAS